MHKCAYKHPHTQTHTHSRERERQRRGITNHKPGSRWENRDQLQSYCLNLIDTTMKLFRQIGGLGGARGRQTDWVRGRQSRETERGGGGKNMRDRQTETEDAGHDR